MKLIVWNVGPWQGSKYNDAEYKRIAFKREDGEKGTIYLNLTKNCAAEMWQKWIPYLKEGNVLNVTMHPNGNVNQFDHFYAVDIKAKNKED